MNIPEKMDAVVLKAFNDFSVDQVDVPQPGLFEVLCKVKSTAICGTDPPLIKGAYKGNWPKAFPFIPGHEWSGEVVALGEKAEYFGWKVGDRVAGTSHAGCGVCRMCTTGRYNLCDNYGNDQIHRQYGHYTNGSFAEYQVTHIKSIFRIPDEMSFDEGAMVDGVSIALHSAKRGKINSGDSVVVFGPGPLGLMAFQCAKALGAARVIVVGRRERLQFAKELGAEIVDLEKVNPVEEILKLSGGKGVEVTIDCAGTKEAILQSLEIVRKGGNVVFTGIPKEPVELPMRKIVLAEINLFGVRANQNTCEESIALMMDKRINTLPMITHRFPLQDFPRALEIFDNRIGGAQKVVLHP